MNPRAATLPEIANVPDARAPDSSMTAEIVNLPFVIISVHLLVVLIGAAYMARAKRRIPTAEDGG